MKKTLFVLLGLLMISSVVFAGGEGDASSSSAVMADPVEEAALAYFAEYPDGGYAIDEKVFVDKVKAGDDMYIIDIRQPDAYAKGHITGAVNMPWSPDLAAQMSLIPQEGEVYVYCYTGQTAGQTVAVMNVLGIPAKSVHYGFDRGIRRVEGYEAVVDKNPVTAEQTVHDIDSALQAAADNYFKTLPWTGPFSENIVSIADAVAIHEAGDDAVQFVDIRRANDYADGHIDTAISIPFGSNMQASFVDLPADKRLIVNCYSGQTSGQTIAILRLLGYDAVSLAHGVGTGKTGGTGWAKEGYEMVK